MYGLYSYITPGIFSTHFSSKAVICYELNIMWRRSLVPLDAFHLWNKYNTESLINKEASTASITYTSVLFSENIKKK